MEEHDVVIRSAGYELAATACIPGAPGRVPAVLMIHGTGPLDRDENMKGQRLDVFNTIAHHLATRGVGSLRYDKRGCGRSSGDYYRAGHADLVGDAISGVDTLRGLPFCDPNRVFVLGHSEGCVIAPQVSAHVVDNLTHVLRYEPGPPSFLGTGALLAKPMEPMVLTLIDTWLDARLRAHPPR